MWPDFDVDFCHFPGGAEEDHRRLSSGCPASGSKYEPGASSIRSRGAPLHAIRSRGFIGEIVVDRLIKLYGVAGYVARMGACAHDSEP